MSQDQQLDEAKCLPEQRFDSPEAVLEHPEFSKEEKRAILEQWKDEAEQLDAASGEGMGDGEPSMLRRVCLALEAVS